MSRRPAAVVGIDFEDWHQIVSRRLGHEEWDAHHASFERQIRALLAMLDDVGGQVTFFLVGTTARHYPDLVAEVVSRGHEIACHGHTHTPVWAQTPQEFHDDLAQSLELIEELSGTRPIGYRAPVFSIDRRTPWAWEILADMGLRYDASQHDTPRNRMRIENIPQNPFVVALPSGRRLLEFPISVRRIRGRPVPIGGGTYWRVLPLSFIVKGLRDQATGGGLPTLYFHPYEFQPDRVRLEFEPTSARQRAKARYSVLRVNFGGSRVPRRIPRIAQDFRFVSHRQAWEDILEHRRLRTTPLPEEGRFI
jgi:polysaccharide deacetylase family protein (PEP-CTERM system associated)